MPHAIGVGLAMLPYLYLWKNIMANLSTNTSATTATQRSADAWINIQLSIGGHLHKLGGIPLSSSDSVQAKLIGVLQSLDVETQQETILLLLSKGQVSFNVTKPKVDLENLSFDM